MLCVIAQALNEKEGPAAMSQAWIPARFYRGGTSKGVFFTAATCRRTARRAASSLLAVLGSPDANGRQLDGMGGGISSLSKAVIIGPSSRADADVDYTFVQLAVDKPVADWTSNCGNLTSAVGPFAVDEGVVRVRDGEALVRIHQTNTRKVIHARFPVEGGRARVDGDFAIAGVAGRGPASASTFSIRAARARGGCCRRATRSTASRCPTPARSMCRSSMRRPSLRT